MSTWKKGAWIPQASDDGKSYCSPACGGGCTMKDFTRAHTEADAVIRKLRGKGWTKHVDENLGWHWTLRLATAHGTLNLTPLRDYERRRKGKPELYGCLMSTTPNSSGGLAEWGVNEYFADPNRAVEEQLKVAIASTDVRVKACCEIEEAFNAK